MTIIESIMHADFGDPKSRDRDLAALKPTKNGHFCLENLFA